MTSLRERQRRSKAKEEVSVDDRVQKAIKVGEIHLGELQVFELSCMGLSLEESFRKTSRQLEPLTYYLGRERWRIEPS